MYQFSIFFFNIYIHPYFLFSIYDFLLLILRWSGHWQYHVEAQHSCSKGRRSSSDRYARTRHIKLCFEIFKFVHKGKKLFSIYFMMLNFFMSVFIINLYPCHFLFKCIQELNVSILSLVLIYLLIYLFIYLFIYQFIYLFIYLFI